MTAYGLYCLYATIKTQHTENFMRIGSRETFLKRKDSKSFSRLKFLLCKHEILEKDDIQNFLIVNAKRLRDEFYPHNLLNNEAIEHYKRVAWRIRNKDNYLQFVFKSFKHINDVCEQSGISVVSYFTAKKKVPRVYKDYRDGLIAEEILVYSKVIDNVKTKTNPILKLYTKDVQKNKEMIRNRINRDIRLQNVLKKGFLYLESEQKRRTERLKSKKQLET